MNSPLSSSPARTSSSGIDVAPGVELYDSDIAAITAGPVAWHETRMKVRRDIDDHAKALEEQFHKIGFTVEVQVWIHSETGDQFEGPVMFHVLVTGRINPESGYDFERQQHEVRANLLDIPGEGGTIKFNEAEFLREHGGGKHGRHTH